MQWREREMTAWPWEGQGSSAFQKRRGCLSHYHISSGRTENLPSFSAAISSIWSQGASRNERRQSNNSCRDHLWRSRTKSSCACKSDARSCAATKARRERSLPSHDASWRGTFGDPTTIPRLPPQYCAWRISGTVCMCVDETATIPSRDVTGLALLSTRQDVWF